MHKEKPTAPSIPATQYLSVCLLQAGQTRLETVLLCFARFSLLPTHIGVELCYLSTCSPSCIPSWSFPTLPP